MEDKKIIDGENYKDENLSWKQIILQQYKKLLNLSCVEWQKSRTEETPITINGMVYQQKKYVEDSRKVFVNGTKAFTYALIGHFDDGMKNAFKVYEQSIKDLQKDCKQQKTDKVDHNISEVFNWKELSITQELFKELSQFLVRINIASLDEEKLEE